MSDKRPTAGEQSTMGLYLRELRRIPQLSREEEQAFAALAAQGDRKARQHLIQANLRFVILVAKRYRNRGVPLEDLVNEGNIGLIHAAEWFDPDRGVRFVSYAVWWIRQAILKAIPENSRLIRLPKSRSGELSRIEELRRDRMMQSGSEPRLAEIAESLMVEEGEVLMLMQAAQGTLSLDSPVTDRENPDPFRSTISATRAARSPGEREWSRDNMTPGISFRWRKTSSPKSLSVLIRIESVCMDSCRTCSSDTPADCSATW